LSITAKCKKGTEKKPGKIEVARPICKSPSPSQHISHSSQHLAMIDCPTRNICNTSLSLQIKENLNVCA